MNPTSTHPSPDNLYRLDIFPVEQRMSHSVDSPYLYDNQTNACIVNLGGMWDASEVEWSKQGHSVSMNLRHYPDGGMVFRIEVDLENGKATLSSSFHEKPLTGTIENVVKEMVRTEDVRTLFE